MPWPVTINGKLYTQGMFQPFGYVENFPNIIQDVSDVSAAAVAAAAANVGAVGTAQALAAAMQAGPVASVYRRGRALTGVVSPDPTDATGVPATKDYRYRFGYTADGGTFGRASQATYLDPMGVLRTAASGALRIDHDGAGANRGILIEESRANLVFPSEALDNASWLKSGCTITANAAVAPDGTTTADKIVGDAGASNRYCGSNAVTGTNTRYAGSVFLRAGEYSRVRVALSNFATDSRGASFNLATGAVVSVEAAGPDFTDVSAGIIPLGNGWYRCWVTALKGSANTVTRFSIDPRDNSGASAGDGVSGVFAWGAQLEAGAFPTAYIPTTSAAATRAADSLIVPVTSDWFNPAEGTFLVEAIASLGPPLTGLQQRLLYMAGAAGDINYVQRSENNGLYFGTVRGGDFSTQALAGIVAPGSPIRFALSSGPGGRRAALNGTTVQNLTAAAAGIAATTVEIGGLGGASHWNAPIGRVLYWPRQLSLAEHQRLTA